MRTLFPIDSTSSTVNGTDSTMPFGFHDSLRPHFKGFQGANPDGSTCLALCKDANFSEAFMEGHEIWSRLIAYLRGDINWLTPTVPRLWFHRSAARIHHPALLRSWPYRKCGWDHHNYTYAKVFDLIADDDIQAALKKFSFVDLLCWPTIGNIGGSFQTLLRGNPGHHLQIDCHAQFRQTQAQHLRKVRTWISNCRGVVFIASEAFQTVCDDGDVLPEVAAFGNEVTSHFKNVNVAMENRWIFDSRDNHPNQCPRLVVTKYFPYFCGGSLPVGLKPRAIGRIAEIIIETSSCSADAG